jgi:hypothetical protein
MSDTIKSVSTPTVHSQTVVNPDGTNIASSLPLPTGAATSEKQDTQTTLLQGIAGFNVAGYDYISLTQNSTQDIWAFKTGGSGGTIVETITITYTGTNKQTISNVVKN